MRGAERLGVQELRSIPLTPHIIVLALPGNYTELVGYFN